jgi:hypothetical protein
VIKAAYPEGFIEFDPEPWHALYWDAWDALRFDRFYGAFGGQGPVSYMTLRAYAEDNGIDGDDFRVFRQFFGVIDNEWLRREAAKAEQEAKARQR